MQAIILLGAPGSGKGTVAERIRDAAGYLHISTGDMLRDAVKKGTSLGQEAESYMKRGELVPDDLMARLVEDRLDRGASTDRYLFDGFPRTMNQADLLDRSLAQRGGRVHRVLFLEATRDLLISRLAGRRTCKGCGANYHIVNIPPRKEGICDRCAGELYQRPDDRAETVVNRLDVYYRQTESLIARYEKQGILVRLNSDRNLDALILEIRNVLNRESA